MVESNPALTGGQIAALAILLLLLLVAIGLNLSRWKLFYAKTQTYSEPSHRAKAPDTKSQ
jgi:hypothetical protein